MGDSLEDGGIQGHEGTAAGRTAASRWTGYDRIIAQLGRTTSGMADGSKQCWQRRFFGRLCNVLFVKDASAMVAVNAALSEVCHLPTTLVAADREAAYSAVAAFRKARVGSVTCKVRKYQRYQLSFIHALPSR